MLKCGPSDLFAWSKSFLKKLPLVHNKKVRKSLRTGNHWSSSYFKINGTLTVSETVSDILDFVYENYCETEESFVESVRYCFQDVLPTTMWIGVIMIAALDSIDKDLKRNKK